MHFKKTILFKIISIVIIMILPSTIFAASYWESQMAVMNAADAKQSSGVLLSFTDSNDFTKSTKPNTDPDQKLSQNPPDDNNKSINQPAPDQSDIIQPKPNILTADCMQLQMYPKKRIRWI